MTKALPNIKYFAYIRKSSEDAERQALSIPAQIDKTKELFGEAVIVDFIVESHSAFIPGNRPGFSRMIERIQRGEAGGIIAWHPDRLSRNEKDAAEITYLVRTGVIKDLLFGSYFFHNSPEGIMMLQLALSQSQYFSSKLGKDVKRGMAKKASMGWCTYLAPAGYLNAKDDESGLNIIIKDSVRFPLVRKIWDLMLTGNYSPAKILDMANNEWGYRTKKRRKEGGQPLSYSGIYKILNNTFYYGWFEYPKGSGNWQKGSHEPMITIKEFDRVQELMGRGGRPRQFSDHEFAFTGCLNCGECKCLVTAETKVKKLKTTKETKYYTYYHCTRRKQDYDCQQRKHMPEVQLEEKIELEVEKYAILPQFYQWAMETINENKGKNTEQDAKIGEMRSETAADLEKQLQNLTQLRLRELISDDEFSKERGKLTGQIAKLKEQSRSEETNARQKDLAVQRVFSYAAYAHIALLKGDPQTKREILVALGSNRTVKDEKLFIQAHPWFVPLKKDYPRIEREYRALEPQKILTNIEQNHPLEVVRSRWLGRWDSNPRPIGYTCP